MHIIKEHYHIYNRGAHKEPIFLDAGDYWRFLCLMYTANDLRDGRRSDLRKIKPKDMFAYRRDLLVEIYSYCLMPNHFHILAKEKVENGITTFMRKLCTGYAMYFNRKYDHSGTIFQGRYKSKHVNNDDYFRYLVEYIHLNPFGIEEPEMTKEARKAFPKEALKYAKNYEYSSLKDHIGQSRPQKGILSTCGAGPTCVT